MDELGHAMKAPAVQALLRGVEKGGVLSFTSISPAGFSWVAGLLAQVCPGRPVVVVTEGVKRLDVIYQDLTTWLSLGPNGSEANRSEADDRGPRQPLYYPPWEVLPHEARLPHADVISERLQTLIACLVAKATAPRAAPVIATAVTALLQKTFPPMELKRRLKRLKRGMELDPLELVEWLEEQDYQPEAQVSQKGELALRGGGIVDVYPPSSPWPVRLEFFGNDLESVRFFDPITQISRDEIEEAVLPPAGELGILKKYAERSDHSQSSENAEASAPSASRETNGRSMVPGLLLDHLPRESIFVLCDPEALDAQADDYERQVPAGDRLFVPWVVFRRYLEERQMTVIELSESLEGTLGTLPSGCEPGGEDQQLAIRDLDTFRVVDERQPETQIGQIQRQAFFDQIHRWLRQEYRVTVFCNNAGERQRFEEIWQELGINRAGTAASRETGPVMRLSALSRGFLIEAARLVVVTDAEIFGRYKVTRPRRLKSAHAQAMRSALEIDFAELAEGDYVVHLQHGIGRFVGLKMLEPPHAKRPAKAEGKSAGQECIVIEYAPSQPENPPPRLYVPISEAHLVSKYVGAGKARPPLDKLGGKRWAKTKERTEHAVRDLAAELLEIQAARATQEGYGAAPDTPWQREFESAFIYEETPDQSRAIVETKRDMEAARPMDRLICGDVGFGKTEVAIRAAFKAVMSGKQVALLAPTTVLVQQHYNTFCERMADYPIRVEMLSRFRSRSQQRRVLEDLAAGSVDIVVGTHRLIQKDVAFRNLGLAVIDEEQRFGVLHKERLKRLRRLVDVLTMSATPIPRTLHLALTGARDMSTIETPPQDRLPVETIVTQFDERVVRDAIQRELNRQGQVFYLHNRVFDIDAVATRVKALVPQARVVVGHGQMDADELEEIMARFVNGEADVLVSTTIIESGLDIPNANTIIINRADRFGLSDLYQLRGRVGRYKHQAYAYLLIPRHAQLLTDARKRISAIRQYSSLGSGFKIAMRDLEIRGAGNLLGTEQSGHINAVGFELYCQLLKQSIATLKGEKAKPRLEVKTRLDFLALSPGDELPRPAAKPAPSGSPDDLNIQIPREVWTYTEIGEVAEEIAPETAANPIPKAPAWVPYNYVEESRARIEVYRKLAQATAEGELELLRTELRDRFGPVPEAVETLFELQELKLIAGSRGVTEIETRERRLMLVRNHDYLYLNGKFPRLKGSSASAALNEIKQLLLTL